MSKTITDQIKALVEKATDRAAKSYTKKLAAEEARHSRRKEELITELEATYRVARAALLSAEHEPSFHSYGSEALPADLPDSTEARGRQANGGAFVDVADPPTDLDRDLDVSMQAYSEADLTQIPASLQAEPPPIPPGSRIEIEDRPKRARGR